MFKEGDQVKHKRLCIEGVVCAVGPADNSRPYTVFSDTSGVIHAEAEDLEPIPNPPKTEELTMRVNGMHESEDGVYINLGVGDDTHLTILKPLAEARSIRLGDEYVVIIKRKD